MFKNSCELVVELVGVLDFGYALTSHSHHLCVYSVLLRQTPRPERLQELSPLAIPVQFSASARSHLTLSPNKPFIHKRASCKCHAILFLTDPLSPSLC